MADPEAQLSAQEQAELTNLLASPVYQTLIKVMEQEVDKFRYELQIAPALTNEDEQKIVNLHKQWKAATLFYARVRARLENESQLSQILVNAEAPEEEVSDADILAAL